ncbi:MAG: hypothetical protein JNJ90_05440 [Saprospiraceae bacterium]|jgi:ligand-binding sensor domain-containing protein|nr:hypothetical protein [Saprospiraceae bacterium]
MCASIWYYSRLLPGIVIACLGHFSLFSQHARTAEYDFRRISMQDGISNQIITAICEDSRGMLWFGTHSGLYRFDGFRVTRFVDKKIDFLSSEYVTDLEYLDAPGGSGYLLVCTWGKGRLLDIAKDRIIPFESQGFPRNIFDKCTQIEKQDDNTYWVIADSTLYRLQHTNLKWSSIDSLGVAPGAPFTKIEISPSNSGGIWLLPTAEEAYYVSASGAYTRCSLPVFKNNPKPIAGLLGLIQTPEGMIGWDYVRNLYRFNYQRGTFEPEHKKTFVELFPAIAALDRSYKQRNILRIRYTLSTGEEAIGTTLGLFIPRKRISQFKVPEGMSGSEIRGILTDSMGNWWAGTYTGFFGGNLALAGINRVSTIQGVWGGIPIDLNQWMLICENRAGIFVLNKARKSVLRPQLAAPMKNVPESALSICRDLAGNIWVGTYTNLFWSPPDAPFDFHRLKQPGTPKPLQAPFFRALLADKDSSVWAGAENGLFRLRYSHSPDRFTLDTILNDLFISDLYADQFDNIWVATKGKGLAKYNRASNTFTWYDAENGLANNSTCRIEASNDDQVLWVSTHDGLSRLDVKTEIIHNYHEEDGIPGNEFNSAASARFPDGTLIFGGVAGLVLFHPDSLRPRSFRYKTFFSHLHLQANSGDSLQLYPLPEGPLLIPPYPRLVEICLGMNDFVQSAKPQFRYRLKGAFKSWVYTNGENKIRFFNLSPGNYTLEVQALPYDGHLGPPVQMTMHVAQPVSETWWFRALMLAGLILISYLAYRYRLRQALRTYIIRQQIADDLHDDIGNKLNMTNILLQKVRRNFLDKGQPLPPSIWADVLEANQQTLQSLRTLIWSVDPRKDRLENIFTRMQDFADDFLHPLNIQYRFSLPEQVPDRETLLDFRHHLIMIYQELLTNMVKHAPPQLVAVQLDLFAENTLTLTIINKFDRQAAGHLQVASDKRGMTTLKRRLDRINGTIKLFETTDTSQTITLSFSQLFK